MTNGSDKLVFRDPVTFATRREVAVKRNGTAVTNLNELECVGSLVYINEWKTDNILRVDKATGNVVTLIDASALLTADEKKNVDVLNGIAYDQSKGRFYLTGKYWPKLFEVSFDFAPGGDGDAGAADAGNSIDAGIAVDANVPRDATSDRSATDDGSTRDAGAPRDAPDGAARDAATDARPSDVSPPPSDVIAPPSDAMPPSDGGNGQGGTGAGGTGAGTGTGAENGCGCRSAGRSASGPAVMALFAAFMLARARRRRTS
jgi:MYXO-CTERM domain-containing protein